MPRFSVRSQNNLGTCHSDLRRIFEEVIKEFDCTVLCGYRNEVDQEKAFAEGRTKVHFPRSKHNHFLSIAVDVVPYPIDWDNIERFKELAKHVHAVADRFGIAVRHGADWNRNGIYTDEKFVDWPHWELVDVL